MPFKINNEALYPLYNMPHTQLAIEYCVKVVELWPLQTAQEMENDAKYMEDLQVGFSCMMARALLRLPDEVTYPWRKTYMREWMRFRAAIQQWCRP